MFSKSISISTLFLLGFVLSGLLVHAQSTGTLLGTVGDESGAVIPAATVTITNKATGATRSLTSNAQGLYSAPALEPGQYEVRVAIQGFRTLVKDAQVFAGTDTTVNMAMSLGESKEVVNVEGSVAQMNYDNQTIAGVVERNSIQELPLNGRSFFALGSLEPGVSIVSSALGARNGPVKISIMGGSGGTGGTGGGTTGGAGAGATYLSLDGLSIMDGLELDPAMTFSQEMVQEFQISTINYQVGPAVTSLGAVNVVSRSGSNEFHGSGFFFYRDHNLSAYPGLKRIPFALNPYFSRKDPGFWVGGPIKKNRAFFFFDWEPQKQVQAVVFQPDLASLSSLAAVFQSPNVNHSLNTRFDYRISDKHTAFLRYTHDGNKNFGVPGTAPVEASDFNHLVNWSDAYALGITSTINATMVNDFRVGWRMWNNAESPVIGSPGDVMAAVNSPDCVLPCIGAGLPQISMIGSGNFAAGQSSGTAKQNRMERHYEPQDTFSWQKGSHNIKIGVDLDVYVNEFLYDYAELGAVSLYSVESTLSTLGANAATIMPNLPSSIRTTQDLENLPVRFGANAFAVGNPILPGPYHFQQDRRNLRWKAYGSDSWKIKPNFTLNYGLGYTRETGLVNEDVPIPSYEAPLFGLPVGSTVGPSRNYTKEFGPVAGFAWGVGKGGKTVIRGGAGMYWDTGSDWVGAKNLSAIGPLGNGRLNIDVSSFTNIFPGVLIQGASGLVPLPVGAGLTPNVFSTLTLGQFMQIYNQQEPAINALFSPIPPQKTGPFQYAAIQYAKNGGQLYAPTFIVPHSFQTSIGVQRDFGHDMVLTADWARRRSISTSTGVDLNHYSEVINGVQTPVIPKCKTSPDFNPADNCSLGAFSFNYDEGLAVYNGLLVKFQKRFSHRYQFIASYALQEYNAIGSVVNYNNLFQSYGPQVARQNLNVAGLVQLRWGFEVSLNSSFISRTPVMPVTTGVDLSGTAATASGPLPGLAYNCAGFSCGKSEVAAAVGAFNTTYAGTKAPSGATIPTYVLPPNYNFGTPQIYQDVRITKTFTYKERYRLAIMGEIFNLFNIANLSGYSYSLDTLAKGCSLTAPGSAFTSCSTQTYAFGQPTNRAQQTFLSGGPRAEQFGVRFTF